MNHQEEQQFYKLLRLSLGLTQEFPVEVDADGWRRLYQTAIRQSLVGVCYQGVCLLPEGSKPPAEIAMQWASEAESIKGMNELLYQEAARNKRVLNYQRTAADPRLRHRLWPYPPAPPHPRPLPPDQTDRRPHSLRRLLHPQHHHLPHTCL